MDGHVDLPTTLAPRRLLFFEQHSEIGGGQLICQSLATHPVFAARFQAEFALPRRGGYEDSLRGAGISVDLYPDTDIRNGPKAIEDFVQFLSGAYRQYTWLVKKLRDGRFDGVYTSSPRYLVVIVLACRRQGIPVYFHLHCFFRRRYEKVLLRLLLSERTVKDVFCPSRSAWRWVSSQLGRRNRVHYVPNWLVTRRTGKPVATDRCVLPRVNDAGFRVGLIGRIVPLKGHNVFLAAVQKLLDSGENIEAYVIGAPVFAEPGGFAEKLQAAHRGNQRIHFVGHQEVMEPVYNELSCVVVASSTEVFGLVAIEAMYNNVPVVVSNVDELPYIVEYGRCGLVFNPQSSSELAREIGRLKEDQSLRNSLVSRAAERVRRLYCRDRSVMKIVRTISGQR